jgi:hypothetical protein
MSQKLASICDIFTRAAQNSSIVDLLLEKDFWVCWTLKELFRLPTIGDIMRRLGSKTLDKRRLPSSKC